MKSAVKTLFSRAYTEVEALRDVSMVMVRGKLDEHPRVKRIPELDAELDEFLPKAC